MKVEGPGDSWRWIDGVEPLTGQCGAPIIGLSYNRSNQRVGEPGALTCPCYAHAAWEDDMALAAGGPETTSLRMRLRADDTHYATGTIPGATYLALMADAGAMLSTMRGDPAGYLARWESADFTTPCNVGDYIEVRCTLLSVGNRSRRMEMEVVRLIRTTIKPGETTVGEVADPPDLVARGIYISVIPKSQAS